jgi:hypothetical protein
VISKREKSLVSAGNLTMIIGRGTQVFLIAESKDPRSSVSMSEGRLWTDPVMADWNKCT